MAVLRILQQCGFTATSLEMRRAPRNASLLPEVLGEAQALARVMRANALAVDLRRRVGQPLEHQPADDLAVLDDEGHLAAAHLQHGAGAPAPPLLMAEAGVEEAGIM